MSGSLERLDAILGSLRVGILAVDADGRVELQNPEASRILGLSGVATARPAARPRCLGAQHPAVAALETALRDRPRRWPSTAAGCATGWAAAR